MKKLSIGQRKVIAEFLSNLGVAWFVAGVIGSFPFWIENVPKAVISSIWGLVSSMGFLRIALFFTKGIKS